MNRRMIVFAIAGAALALFAGASFFYLNRAPVPPSAAIEAPAIDALGEPAETPDADAPSRRGAHSGCTRRGAAPTPRWTVYVRQHSPVIGPVDARVTIVEFLDPACEACRAFYPIVHEILRRHPNDVRLVVRYTPLHEGSEEAVRILETARMQNRFEPVLTALFQQQPRWADHGSPQISIAWDAAASAGLNVDTARAAMAAPHIDAVLRQDIADARTLGVRGTPTFFVNEQPLANFSPQGLYDLVRAELAGPERAQ